MGNELKFRYVVFTLLFVGLLNNVFGGWIITEESTDKFNNRSVQTTFIEGNYIRHETPTSIAIIDLDSSKITMVFSQYKTYWKGTAEDLRRSTVLAYDKELETMLAGIPDYQRKELDSIYAELRNEILNPKERDNKYEIDILKTDNTDSIIGYNAVKYNVMIDSVLKESIWFTNVISPYKGIDTEKMIAFMEQVNPAAKSNLSTSEEYIKMWSSGIILKTVGRTNVEIGYTTTVTNIREVVIPSELFKPPANYMFAELRDILNMVPVNSN